MPPALKLLPGVLGPGLPPQGLLAKLCLPALPLLPPGAMLELSRTCCALAARPEVARPPRPSESESPESLPAAPGPCCAVADACCDCWPCHRLCTEVDPLAPGRATLLAMDAFPPVGCCCRCSFGCGELQRRLPGPAIIPWPLLCCLHKLRLSAAPAPPFSSPLLEDSMSAASRVMQKSYVEDTSLPSCTTAMRSSASLARAPIALSSLCMLCATWPSCWGCCCGLRCCCCCCCLHGRALPLLALGSAPNTLSSWCSNASVSVISSTACKPKVLPWPSRGACARSRVASCCWRGVLAAGPCRNEIETELQSFVTAHASTPTATH